MEDFFGFFAPFAVKILNSLAPSLPARYGFR